MADHLQSEISSPKSEIRVSSRPSSVTLLAIGVLTFAGINLLRLVQVLAQWQFLAELLPVPPIYLALSGLVWGAVGLPVAWGLLRGRPWAPLATRLLVVAYLVYYWIDRLWLSTGHTNIPFAILASLAVILLVLWNLSRPGAKAFFRH